MALTAWGLAITSGYRNVNTGTADWPPGGLMYSDDSTMCVLPPSCTGDFKEDIGVNKSREDLIFPKQWYIYKTIRCAQVWQKFHLEVCIKN